MKKNEWNEGLSNIDIDLVEEYVKKKEKLADGKRRTSALIRYGTVAACVVLALGVLIAVPLLRWGDEPKIPMGDKVESDNLKESDIQTSANDNNIDSTPHNYPIPQILDKITNNANTPNCDLTTPTITLSAEDVAKIFDEPDDHKEHGTNLYKELYTYSEEHLNIKGVPDAEYLPFYTRNSSGKSDKKFSSFIDKYVNLSSNLFYIELTSQTFKSLSDSYVSYGSHDYRGMLQRGLEFRCLDNGFICSYIEKDTDLLKYLKNVPENVLLLETDSDEQIVEKLKGTMTAVCSSFDKKYTNIRIIRNYTSYGLDTICVYLYTPSETAFLDGYYRNSYYGSINPIMSEYIKITYLNDLGPGNSNHHWGGEKGELALIDVSVFESFSSSSEYYSVIGKSKMINLETAEELLNKGYVFGGHHVCPICLSLQTPVDFSDYDFVDLEYVYDYEGDFILPFYTFYKHLGKNVYGLETYAKTYVCAIEVEGLKEYFESQKEDHDNTEDIVIE